MSLSPYTCPKIYNSLPNNLRSIASKKLFRKKAEEYIWKKIQYSDRSSGLADG